MNVIYRGLLALSLISSSCFATAPFFFGFSETSCASSQSLSSMADDTPSCFLEDSPSCDERLAASKIHVINGTAATIEIFDKMTRKTTAIPPTGNLTAAVLLVCFTERFEEQFVSPGHRLICEIINIARFPVLSITSAEAIDNTVEIEEKDTPDDADEAGDELKELPSSDSYQTLRGASGWSPYGRRSPDGYWSPGRGVAVWSPNPEMDGTSSPGMGKYSVGSAITVKVK
jgi:hypothetical protein